MLPSRIRLVRDPLARANGTTAVTGAVLSDLFRPNGTIVFLFVEGSTSHPDPQYFCCSI